MNGGANKKILEGSWEEQQTMIICENVQIVRRSDGIAENIITDQSWIVLVARKRY